jgi:hypothetical protein
MKKIQYFVHSADLGDLLFTTPLLRALNGSGELILEAHIKTKRASQLYTEMADIKFVDPPLPFNLTISTWNTIEHKSQQILNRFNLGDSNPIPYVKLPNEEELIKRGKEVLRDIVNPIYVNFETRAFNESSDPITYYRVPSVELVNYIILLLKANGYTPVAFPASKESHRVIPGIKYIYGLDLLTLAGCVKTIGKYVGIDSGTLHLSLAVGGKALGIVPPSHDIAFPHRVYLWLPEMWKYEEQRANYYVFGNPLNSLQKQINNL